MTETMEIIKNFDAMIIFGVFMGLTMYAFIDMMANLCIWAWKKVKKFRARKQEDKNSSAAKDDMEEKQ